MFPVTEKYVDHIHTVDGKPVTIHKELAALLKRCTKEVLILEKKGRHIVFSDIRSARQIMIEELKDRKLERTPLCELQQQVQEQKKAAKTELRSYGKNERNGFSR